MIRGFVYDPETGEQSPLDLAELGKFVAGGSSIVWLDLSEPTDQELKLLEDPFHFHPLAAEDARSKLHHPKVEEFDDHLFLIAHTVRDDATPRDYRPVQMAMFLGRRWLVTVHSGMDEIDDLLERCRGGNRLLKAGTTVLAHKVLDRMIDQYAPFMANMSADLEGLEGSVLALQAESSLDDVFALKRSLSRIRQTAVHTKVLLHVLANRKLDLIDSELQSYFRDVEDHAIRIADECDAMREVIADAIEAHASATNHRLNQTMKVLTVISVIFAPLTFIAGIYGMNFDFMPELRARPAYFVVLAVMGVIAIVLILLFKRRRWL